MIQKPLISSEKFLSHEFSFAKSYVNLCGLKHNFFLSFSFNQVDDYDLFPLIGLFSYSHSNLSVDLLGFGAGKSIFVDGKAHPFKDENGNITSVGIMSLGMRIGYIIFGNPLYWIWDLIVNGGF